jgi:hypothetical protein
MSGASVHDYPLVGYEVDGRARRGTLHTDAGPKSFTPRALHVVLEGVAAYQFMDDLFTSILFRALLFVLAILATTARADELAVADVVPALARVAAKPDAKTPVGNAIEIGTLARSNNVASDAKVLRDAIAAAHYPILLDVDEGRVVITIAIDKTRATIVLSEYGGTVALTPHPSTTRVSGSCVAIPSVDHEIYVSSRGIDQRGQQREGHTRIRYGTYHGLDVDGDGIPDALVPAPASKDQCGEELVYRVFVVRGACGHEVGRVGPGWIELAGPPDASGFHPLVATAQSTGGDEHGAPTMNTLTTRFAVRHGAYVKLDSSSTSGTCHHCGHWSCTGA